VAPVLLWTTPLIGGLLLLGAHQAVRRPLVAPASRRGELPPELEARVVRTLAELPDGSARGLLADVVRLARPLFWRLTKAGDDRGIGPSLSELVAAAVAGAADLAMLDENLERFEAQRARAAAQPDGWLDALARSERARDALVQRLLEAMTVLRRLSSQATERTAGEDSSLAEITRELRCEADAQVAAAHEIEALLRV
jgi:hypothetical protein